MSDVFFSYRFCPEAFVGSHTLFMSETQANFSLHTEARKESGHDLIFLSLSRHALLTQRNGCPDLSQNTVLERDLDVG